MTIGGATLTARLVTLAVAVLVNVTAVTFGPAACQRMKSLATQSRVDREQGRAAIESGNDAGEMIAGAGQREAGSEDLTRANEREIRAADGAGNRVGAGVDAAGRKALCRREAYRNDPKCAIFKGATK